MKVGIYYYRKIDFIATVRLVLSIENGVVEYLHIYHPRFPEKAPGRCGVSRFRKWVTGQVPDEIIASGKWAELSGATIHATYVVLNRRGESLLRCSERRAKFYLKKGYASEVADHTLQFNDDITEKTLRKLYGDKLDNPFFMEKKNERCCVCGASKILTRHHIVPQRVKAKLPLEIRRRLSNVLFTCAGCHANYERLPEPVLTNDPEEYVLGWEQHFLETMHPKFLPSGWKLITC